ncbi:SdrD B-like domain-containing protein [Fibrella sp. WM1]|uniref:SdrD B-like domain-containing protein n=1 Tax=Fibrella musci TaxID=3242485 RepID=UPI0035210960
MVKQQNPEKKRQSMNQLHTRFYPNRIRQYSTSAGAVLRSVPPRACTPAPTGRSSGFIYVLLALLGLFAASPSYRAQAQTLQVRKTVDQTTVNPNEPLTYTIQYNCVSITNPCTNVVIKDVIPNLYEVSFQPNNAVYDANLNQVTFNLGNLPAGTTGEVKIIGKVNAGNPGGTVMPNSATITSGSSTTVSNTVSTTINSVLSLDVNKSALADPGLGAGRLMQGGKGYYNLYFGSAGNVDKTNFCVVDTLPMADKLRVKSIYTGTINNYAGQTFTIQYQTNLNSTWTSLAGSPFASMADLNVPITLPSNEYVTIVRWCFPSAFTAGAYTLAIPRVYFDVAADAPLGTFKNCMYGTSDQINRSACATVTIEPPRTGAFISFDKVLVGSPSRTVGDTVTYQLVFTNGNSPSQPLNNPIIADVFKTDELQFVSWTYTSQYGATMPVFSSTTSGANTFLKWKLNESVPTGRSMTITLKVIVKNSSALTQKNNAGYIIADNIGGCPYRENVDTYDIDGDGNTTEMTCSSSVPITLQALAKLTSEKLVKGQLDAGYSKYPDFGLTVPGGLADYRLRVSNQGNVPMTSVQVIDILPFIGDKGVLDIQNRLTQWRPNLAGPVTPPTGVTVYYSTESNPCRPELGYSPAGCTTANWSTAPPADITKVQSLKFDFGSIVLQPGDSLLLTWPMRAPTTAPTAGETAWNSFGYVGVRTDNNQPLLPAEPIKVGIKVQPLTPAVYGDFVWLDTNKDGIQDLGELGISGVKVELYKDNGDGVADKTTDTFVGFTVTDGSGNYLFPNLAPGDYFAVFYPPSGYAVSPSLVGSDKTKDSEGIIAAVTSLSATEIDLTWDLGLYPSTTCDVKVANTTVSPCSYSGGVSRATVNVFVTWANPPAGQNITVTLAGANPQTINVTGGATSPALVSFTVAANGAAHAITAGFSPACQDAASILAPQPCAPAVCALGISNVLPGACTGTRREVNATLSWSNGPVGEDIVVTWDGVAVDTIQVTNGLTSPQPTRFYVPGGTGTHTLEAHFSSNTACSASVSSLTVAACVLPCEVSGVIATPGMCNSATNQYTVTGTINLMNTTGGVATITDGAKSTTVSVPASAASVAYSLSGLTSGTGTHIVTVSLPGCGTAMATYTAPGSCTVAPPIPLLSKLVSTRRAELGSIVSYTLALANTSSIASATTTVTDSFSAGLTAIPGTTTASVGTVTSTASGFSWVVPSLPASTTATLVFSASLTQQGIVYNTATTPDGQTATTCTTVPVHICAGVPFEFELSVPTSFTSYQWSRNGQPIAGATSATLSVTAAGIYTVSGTNAGGCADGSCCPFDIVEDAPPSLSALGVAATCTGATSNSNAAIQLTGSNSDAVSYNISVGSSYSATTALYASPRSLSSVVGGVLATQGSNPELQSGGTYTIRVYSGSGCYRDVMVLIPAANCACPPVKCAPYIVKRTKVGGKPVRP